MCDIDNPMYGPTGASYIFGPQKGADEAMVEELDAGIKNLSRVIAEATGEDISQVPGTGAAGAMGRWHDRFLWFPPPDGYSDGSGYRKL